MTPVKIIVTILTLLCSGFIYWFFLGKKDEQTVQLEGNSISVKVEGGYTPNIISIPKGMATTIKFLRNDPSSCLEEIVIPEFRIRKYLPLKKETSITITPKRVGEFPYSCGMNMFHGKIIVTK